MNGERFSIDTNVLVYSVDRVAGLRHDTARAVVGASHRLSCVVTLQALSEFFSVATRKKLIPAGEASEAVREWIGIFETATSSVDSVLAAIERAASGRLSYWDASSSRLSPKPAAPRC